MKVVVDASVIVKWVFPGSEAEEDIEQALELLEAIKGGTEPAEDPAPLLQRF